MKLTSKLNVIKKAILAVMLVPVLYISRYMRPVADDYNYGLKIQGVVESNGSLFEILEAAWNACRRSYETWQGTYSSCFVMPLQPGVYEEKIYGITTWILVGMFFLGFVIFFHVLKKNILKNLDIWYFALLSTVVVVLGMPYPLEGLYWYNSAMHYIIWTILTIINMALMIEIYYGIKKSKNIILVLISCVLSFLISGGNQCTAFVNILLLLLVNILFAVNRKPLVMTSSLIVAIIGFLIMWIAPGNSVRQSNFVTPSILNTIYVSARYAIEFLIEWLNVVSLTAVILFAPLISRLAKKIKDCTLCRFPIITFLATMLVFCGMICVPWYGMKVVGPNRLINVIWLYFIMALILNITCILGYLENKNGFISNVEQLISNRAKEQICLFCLCVIFCYSSANTTKFSTSTEAIRELVKNEAQTFASEMDARYEIYEENERQDVVVKPLSVTPKLLFFDELNKNPGHWCNQSVAKFYKIKSVRIE